MYKPHNRLRLARIAKGYANAKAFAEKYKIPYATYIAHENGKIPLSQAAASKYAKALEIPEQWLLHGDVSIDSDFTGGTPSIHLRKKALEPIILPIIITDILKAIDRYDEEIDYEALIKKARVIMSEILAKTDDMTEIESYIPTIITLEGKTLSQSILHNNKKTKNDR